MRIAIAVLCLIASTSLSAQQLAPESMLGVQVFAASEPSAAKAVKPGIFHLQQIKQDGVLVLEGEKPQLEALRAQFRFDGRILKLNEWLKRGEQDKLSHLGWAFCGERVKWGVGIINACFRDTDNDGRLDQGVTTVNFAPPEGYRFVPIPPVAYRYVRADRRKDSSGGPFVGLTYRADQTRSTHLQFNAIVQGSGFSADLDQMVVVDTRRLPQDVEILGAKMTVTAWDGKRAMIAVTQPLSDRPFRLISGAGKDAIALGRRSGWAIQLGDASLPVARP